MATESVADDIAIIGMAANFAGAPDVETYWSNILAGRDMVVDAPDSWARPYFDPDSRENSRIYTRRGGFLGDIATFDPLEFGIMPGAIDGGEPDQYLALKLAKAALVDAGYGERSFNNKTTGVIIGRGTYVNRGYTNLMQHGLVIDQTLELLKKFRPDLDDAALKAVREEFRQQLPPFSAEMSAGLVPNVVAGRIASRLDLMGPNFIVDAACASSLIAIDLAMDHLRRGECDMMITGGVHASTPPQIYMIFCQLNALSRSRIRPFDRNADGVLLGEGAGLIVLKRLADAEAAGDRIYAVIKGVGKSSDGKALGLLAPRIEGEILAVERAYKAARIDPTTVQLMEAHGTGIPLGDQTEIKALTAVFGQRRDDLPSCAIGSVKSMIGHCIPAAGAAGIIKMALALHQRILPPTLCEEPNTNLGIEQSPFYINTEAQPWVGNSRQPRRAGINAFGFGGVNSHAVLEEYRPAAKGIIISRRPTAQWPYEICAVTAASAPALCSKLSAMIQTLENNSPPFAALVRELQDNAGGAHRLSIVAESARDLQEKTTQALNRLVGENPKPFKLRSGVFYGTSAVRGKTAILMPGEGSQYSGMLRDVAVRFPGVGSWLDFLDETFGANRKLKPSQIIFPPLANTSPEVLRNLDAQLYGMDLGSESVFVATMALYELVTSMGLKPDALLGHSTGEYAAMVTSGMLLMANRDNLAAYMHDLNRIYHQLLAEHKVATGVMMAVGAINTEAFSEVLSAHPGVRVPMDNCLNQRVVFGSSQAIERLSAALRERGAICNILPFDRAYHTPEFASAATAFAGFYHQHVSSAPRIPVFSATELQFYPADLDGIRMMAHDQWIKPVRFREAIEHLYAEGFRQFVEVGPSSSLTGFVRDTLRDRPHVAVALDSRRQSGLRHMLMSIAQLQTFGLDLNVHGDDSSPMTDYSKARHKNKPACKLSLTLPRFTIDTAAPQPLSAVPPGLRVTEPAEPVTAVPQTVMPVASITTLATVAASQSSDDVLARHFALMQRFLKTQELVHEHLLGQFSARPAAERVASSQAGNTAYPLLGAIERHTATELVASKRVDIAVERFLRHHTLGPGPSRSDPERLALPVVPFTFSMEILAEAARALVGAHYRVIGMRNLRGTQWLALDKAVLELTIKAQTAPDSLANRPMAHVAIFHATDIAAKRSIPLFEGMVILSAEHQFLAMDALAKPATVNPTSLSPDKLYTTGMFHGPMLQGVSAINSWWDTGIEAELTVLPTEVFFAGQPDAVFSTDAGLLDAAGQLVGYWLTEKFGSDFNCFPFLVKAFDINGPWPAVGERVTCRGRIGFTSKTQLEAAFVLFDATGRPFAQLLGWTDRYFRIPERFYRVRLDPWNASLAAPLHIPGLDTPAVRVEPFSDDFLEEGGAIWKRVLAHLLLSGNELEIFYSLPETGSRRTEWLLGRVAAKELIRSWALSQHQLHIAPADISIVNDADGKPSAFSQAISGELPGISISHQNGIAIAAIAPPGQAVGIDLQHFPQKDTANLIALRFAPKEKEILEQFNGEEKKRAVIIMWSAKEAAAKSAEQGLFSALQEWIVQTMDAATGSITVSNGKVTLTVRFASNDTSVVSGCITNERIPSRLTKLAVH